MQLIYYIRMYIQNYIIINIMNLSGAKIDLEMYLYEVLYFE